MTTAAPDHTFAVVVSKFNDFVTDRLQKGALAAFQSAGARQDAVTVVHVPGAFEIPIAAQKITTCAVQQMYDDWNEATKTAAEKQRDELISFQSQLDELVKSGKLGYSYGLLWPRQVYGRLVEELTAQGAKVVGFDVLFAELRHDPAHAPIVLALPGGVGCSFARHHAGMREVVERSDSSFPRTV